MVAQNGRGLPWIVVAVVKEENDLTADLALEPASGHDFGPEKTFWEKPAGLLAEADDRLAHYADAGAGPLFWNTVVCRAQEKRSTAVQPMKLYQR